MNRRQLLKNLAALMAAGTTNCFMGSHLAYANRVLSESTLSDYKTLVCIFLRGGADSLPLIVPNKDDEYEAYAKLRQHLVYKREESTKLVTTNRADLDVSLPNFGSALSTMFNDGNLSIVSNVGPLIQPVTLAQIEAKTVALPKFLSSHTDQVSLWQAGSGNIGLTSGWGGRLYEVFQSTTEVLPANISIAGIDKFLQGNFAPTYVVNSTNPQVVNALSANREQPLDRLFESLQSRDMSFFENEYGRTLASAMDKNALLAEAFSTTQDVNISYDYTNPDAGYLADQLKVAARLIEIAPIIGQHRQILFINMYDYDTHDFQDTRLPKLIGGLGNNIKAFIEELTLRKVDENVVVFTQSDFGRTLTINGDGSDHGWGGHQFVAGTPVKGGQIIGTLPKLHLGTDDSWSNMIIPTYSVEQYGAQLARWMGITDLNMSEVFPSYGNFDAVDMRLFN